MQENPLSDILVQIQIHFGANQKLCTEKKKQKNLGKLFSKKTVK